MKNKGGALTAGWYPNRTKFMNCLFVHCHFSLVMRKLVFAYAKTKTQISFAVTAKLISAFVFATRIIKITS